MYQVFWPDQKFSEISWSRPDGMIRNRSSMTGGVARTVEIGPSPRWSASASIVPRTIEQIAQWERFAAELSRGDTWCDIGVYERPQILSGVDNLLYNHDFSSGLTGWTTTGTWVRYVNAPSIYQITFGSLAAGQNAIHAAHVAVAPGESLGASAWVYVPSTVTLAYCSLIISWRDGGGSQISWEDIPFGGPFDRWTRWGRRMSVPAGAATAVFSLSISLTGGEAIFAQPRLSRSVEWGRFGASVGRAITITDLDPGRRALEAGQKISIELPDDRIQRLTLLRPLDADASGTGTAVVDMPLRAAPVVGVKVDLRRPFCRMYAVNPMAWSVRPLPLYQPAAMQFEEF